MTEIVSYLTPLLSIYFESYTLFISFIIYYTKRFKTRVLHKQIFFKLTFYFTFTCDEPQPLKRNSTLKNIKDGKKKSLRGRNFSQN